MSGATVERPWSVVLDVDGPPIEAKPETFDGLAEFFGQLAQDTDLVAESFDKIVNDANADFQGEAAVAFAGMVGDLGTTLALVPATAREAVGFLRSHATELTALREAANTALARANTRYDEVQRAEETLRSAQSGRNNLQQQVDNFDATVCGDDSHRVQAQLDLDDARRAEGRAETALDDARDELGRSKIEYNNLVEDYRELDNQTCTDLDNIKLGDLSDPSWWEQAWNGVSGFIVDLVTDIFVGAFEMVAGLVTGDWERMLWGMSDFLGGVLTVLSLLAFATGFGAPLAIALLATTKLVIDAGLMFADSTNPRTGEQISLVDLAFTGLTAAAGGFGARAAATAPAGTPAQSGFRSLFMAPNGGPGQLRTVATGLGTSSTQAAVTFQLTPTASGAGRATVAFATSAAPVVPDAVQAASTIQTGLGTLADGQAHADESSFGVVPQVTVQLDDIDASQQAPAGYGTIVLVPVDEE